MRNVLTRLAKIVSLLLGLKAAAAEGNGHIQRKIYGLWMTALIISNKEIKNIIKIVKSFQDSGKLVKSVNETIEKEVKEQKGEFFFSYKDELH